MLSDYLSAVGSTEVLDITVYITAVQDITACIIAFKIFGYTLAVLMIQVCHLHYPVVLLLTTYNH